MITPFVLENASAMLEHGNDSMFRMIVDTSLDAIGICSLPDRRFVYVNEAYVQMTGVPRDKLVGHTLGEFNFGVDAAEIEEIGGRLAREGAVRDVVIQLTSYTGKNFTLSLSAVMVEQEGEPRIIWMMRDITDLKATEASLRAEVAERTLTEQRLRESEAMIRKVIETSLDCITIVRTSDGTYREVNEAFLKQFGYERDEVLGRTLRDLQIWSDKAEAREAVRRLRTDSVIKNMEVSYRHRDGTLMPYLLSAVQVYLGSEQCVIAIAHDIAEIKRTEREMVAAREAALAASKAKSEFLSSMSHEIRTPMNAILGMAELLAETSLDPLQQKFLGIMQSNGNALLALINDILDLARIESGRLSLEQTTFQLDTLVEKVAETLAPRAHGKGLELVARTVPDTPINLVGDPLRLRQILINLLGNAIKFTEAGEIVLTVEPDHEKSAPGGLHFSVKDTGIGIHRDRIGALFQNFTQVDSSTTRRYGGSGLGLAIVKRLVELMDGRVWVESEAGKGSTFHFTASLLIDESPPAEELAGTAAFPAIAGMRTLIVDDNATNRLLLHEILTPLGARLSEAADGAEALAAIAQARAAGDPYRLMLLDCRMPGIDGIEVVERLGGQASRGVIVLMLTSDDLRMSEPRVRQLQLDAHLVKPVPKKELLEAIAVSVSADRRLPSSTARKLTVPKSGSIQLTTGDPALNILLAEDSPDNRLLVRAYLKNTPHHLVEAENGEIAVRKFKQEPFDLVLMDIHMPVMDGLAATRAIREWETLRHLRATPIVALTASALGDDVQKCFDAGVTVHVAKPVKKATLFQTIRETTAKAEASTPATDEALVRSAG